MIHAMIKKKHQAGKDRGPARGRYPCMLRVNIVGPLKSKQRHIAVKYCCAAPLWQYLRSHPAMPYLKCAITCADVPVPPGTRLRFFRPWHTPSCTNRSKHNKLCNGHEIFRVAWCKNFFAQMPSFKRGRAMYKTPATQRHRQQAGTKSKQARATHDTVRSSS